MKFSCLSLIGDSCNILSCNSLFSKSFKMPFSVEQQTSEDNCSWTLVLLRYVKIQFNIVKLLSLVTDVKGMISASLISLMDSSIMEVNSNLYSNSKMALIGLHFAKSLSIYIYFKLLNFCSQK